MDKLTGRVRAAVQKYDLIDEGDKIAVGVSGGKDSLFLLCALAELSHYYPKHYTVTAVTADPVSAGCRGITPRSSACATAFPFLILLERQIWPLILRSAKRRTPVPLRSHAPGHPHNLCLELGLNKLALGHHFDDAVQTFFMNLFYGGRSAAFPPRPSFPANRSLSSAPWFSARSGRSGARPAGWTCPW